MNSVRERIEIEEKANIIKELTEGYQIQKKEDSELTLCLDTSSGDGIENSS